MQVVKVPPLPFDCHFVVFDVSGVISWLYVEQCLSMKFLQSLVALAGIASGLVLLCNEDHTVDDARGVKRRMSCISLIFEFCAFLCIIGEWKIQVFLAFKSKP